MKLGFIEAKFKDLGEANEFIAKNSLFQCDSNGVRLIERMVLFAKRARNLAFCLTRLPLKMRLESLKKYFIKNLEILRNLAQNDEQKSYVKYLESCKMPFAKRTMQR